MMVTKKIAASLLCGWYLIYPHYCNGKKVTVENPPMLIFASFDTAAQCAQVMFRLKDNRAGMDNTRCEFKSTEGLACVPTDDPRALRAILPGVGLEPSR